MIGFTGAMLGRDRQGHPVPSLGEATSHGFSEAGPGADQQQVTPVDRAEAYTLPFVTDPAFSAVGVAWVVVGHQH